MSGPTTVIQRRDLASLVKDFDLAGNREGHVGLAIMPLFDTPLQSGNFPKMEVAELMKPSDVKRAPRGAFNRIDFGFTQDSYTCEQFGLELPVDGSIAKNYASYFDAEMEAQDILLDQLARAQEVRIKTIVEAESANNVSVPWSTSATATPRVDVYTGMKAVKDRTGIFPDSLVMTWDKFQDILSTAEFQDSSKYTSNVLGLGFDAQKSIVASFLGVQNLYISYGVLNSAKEGQAFSGTGIWTDTSAFLYIAGNSGLQGGPKYGRTMNWSSDELVNTESYEEPQTDATIIRVRHHRDEKVIASSAGYRLASL